MFSFWIDDTWGSDLSTLSTDKCAVSLNAMTPAVEPLFCPLCHSVKESRREVHPCQWKTGSMYVMSSWKFACRSCHQQQKVLTDRALYHWRRADWCFHTLSRNGMALDLLQHVKDGHFTVGEDIYHQRREDFQDITLGHRPVAIAATVMLLQIPGAANYIHDVGYCARGRWYESYAGMLQLRGDYWSVHVVELFA